MNLWMHGCGKEPQKGVELLKQLGFRTVVSGPDDADIIQAAGMDAYICSGAYRGPDFRDESYLAEDVYGTKRTWFASTCPTRPEVRAYNLERIRQMASQPGIKGILIDGARFASPSSGETTDAFFTCFCPECMKKARSMGFDDKAMHRAATALYDRLHGEKVDIRPHLTGLAEWFSFRRAATTEHLLNFVTTVKSVNPDLKAGIYIFAPSLSDLVGQHYRDLIGKMDIVAPMLYRCYSDPNGPACLNVEIADMLRMLEGDPQLTAEERMALLQGLCGTLNLGGYQTPAELQAGFPPESLRSETAKARLMSPGSYLAPIIQLDDPELDAAIEETVAGGADAVNFFVYQQEWVEKNAEVFERLSKA